MQKNETRPPGSGQDGGIGRNALHNQKKCNNQFRKNKQPELPENQTACNSDNEGVKETFIQTSRRAEMGSWVERICSKAEDHARQAGLATRKVKTL